MREAGRLAALGHAAVKVPVGESITVDFGAVRSPLGALIDWGEAHGTVFSTHLSDDGETFREMGRIETGDGGSDSFWWRSTTSRYFRLTVHRGERARRRRRQRAQAAHPQQGSHADRAVGAGGAIGARRALSAIAARPPSLLDGAGRVRSGRAGAVRRIWRSRAATRLAPDHAAHSARRRASWRAGLRERQPALAAGSLPIASVVWSARGRRAADDRLRPCRAGRWPSTASPTAAPRRAARGAGSRRAPGPDQSLLAARRPRADQRDRGRRRPAIGQRPDSTPRFRASPTRRRSPISTTATS